MHRKLLGMTSNTCGIFETGEMLWSCWLTLLNRSRIQSLTFRPHSDIKESAPKWLRQRPTTGNSNGLGGHIAISGCRSLSQSFGVLSLNSSWSNCSWNFDAIYHTSMQLQRYKYFQFGRPYCYFRLSVADAIIRGHILWTRQYGKPQVWRVENEHICCSST